MIDKKLTRWIRAVTNVEAESAELPRRTPLSILTLFLVGSRGERFHSRVIILKPQLNMINN